MRARVGETLGGSSLRRGFSVPGAILMVVVLGVVASVSLPAVGPLSSELAVHESRRDVMLLTAQARTAAVQREMPAMLYLDAEGDSAWVTVGGATLYRRDFRADYSVDLGTSTDVPVRICFKATGRADGHCSSFRTPVTLSFARGSERITATLEPIGLFHY